ncbi:MAG: hypothetical protein JWQ39_1400 [Glaciihabitans sp.]|jgi:hypothetical protein|nr:hypothetical protein [Glaciihabitans sp.]
MASRTVSARRVAWRSKPKERQLRKFIFNGSIISAIFGGISAVRATKDGPRDWRTVLLWISWLATIASAIGTVVIDAQQAELEED